MKKPLSRLFLPLLGSLILASATIGHASGQGAGGQGKTVPENFCITPAVLELYNMITEYRRTNGLPPAQLSRSLCYVAALHLKDLTLHHPDQGPCNFHSWSASGFWKPFCYPKDENKKNTVWDKPQELTTYPAKAYEIVYWENTRLVTDSIIMVWKTEEYFNNFLLNTGKWQGIQWHSIGIAVSANYACAWFGEAADPEGEAWVCGAVPSAHPKDTLKPVPPARKPKATTKPAAVTDTLAPKPVPAPLPKTAAEASTADTSSKTWYIIVKTNLTPDAAAKFVTTLKAGEYPDAKVLRVDDKIRISVFESTSKPVIQGKLKEVKQTYRDAWLFRH